MSDGSYKIAEDDVGPGFTCENCGSQSFKVEGNQYVCQSCGTSYRIIKKQEPIPVVATPQPQEPPKTIPQQQKQQNTTETTNGEVAACCVGLIIIVIILSIINTL